MFWIFTLTSFFFQWSKSGRSITVTPDEIFGQTFFEGIEKGWNGGLVGVLITSGYRKCPKKIYTLMLKMIGCERKCQFFSFFVALIEIWLQNQIKRIISGIIPTFFVWIRHIWENKNITSSVCYHCFSIYFRFFGHFWLPEVIETSTKPQFQPPSMPSKKVCVNTLSVAAVMERPDFLNGKKTRQTKILSDTRKFSRNENSHRKYFSKQEKNVIVY